MKGDMEIVVDARMSMSKETGLIANDTKCTLNYIRNVSRIFGEIVTSFIYL